MSDAISRVLSLGDHLSRTTVTGRLKQPTRKHDGPPYRLLFGLATDGVYICPGRYRPGGELLPHHFTLTKPNCFTARSYIAWQCTDRLFQTAVKQFDLAVSFLLHWPGSHLHRMLSGILPCVARTFLGLRHLTTPKHATTCIAHLFLNKETLIKAFSAHPP